MEMDNGVKEYLRSLQASLESQETTIESLRAKNKKLEEQLKAAETKTDELEKEVKDLREQLDAEKAKPKEQNEAISITEEITKAAEQVVSEQFLKELAYEETTGLYYDYKSGLYYDATRKLFYDGEKGCYLEYNPDSGKYIPIGKFSDKESTSSSSPASSPEPSPPKEETDLVKSKTEDKPPRELSDGEVSSPSPPPPSPPRKKKKKKSKKDYESYYYPDDRRSQKKRKKERSIPCIRMVVHATSDASENVRVGTLFIVTCKGGTIGREGNHDVLLDDVACSKNHGKIEFSQDDEKYYLVDTASQNGTFVDGKRLSSAKQTSHPREIGHGTLIRIGSTQIICHVHPGSETCLKCEPGVIISSQAKLKSSTDDAYVSREAKRKAELKQLRKKYGVNDHEVADDSLKCGYTDRADERRKTKGSDNPYEKTQAASSEEAISGQNKGFKLLQKMGWKDGDGLGKNKTGRVEPVKVEERTERQGLGCHSSMGSITLSSNHMKRMEALRKTQERFSNLS